MNREPGRAARVALGILIASILGTALLSLHDTWVIDPDSAAYVGLARALASGKGYTFAGVPHTKYPPFFPGLLALVIEVAGPEAYRVMQAIPALAWVLSLALLYRFFSGKGLEGTPFTRAGLPRTSLAGLAFALLSASSIYLVQYGVVFLRTETLFLALSLGALYAACGMEGPTPPRPARMIAFALLFQCAVLTRLAGAVMLPALVAALLLRKGSWLRAPGGIRRGVLLLLLCLPGPVWWTARNASIRAEGATGYMEEFTQRYGLDLTKNRDLEMERVDLAGLAERVAGNGEVFAASCAKLLFNSNKGGARTFLALGAGILCLAGLAALLLRRFSVVDLYALFYLLLYLTWPFNQQQRFYLPILPLLLEYAGWTVGILGRRFLPGLLRVRGAPAVCLLAGTALVGCLLAGRSRTPHLFGRYSVEYFAFTLAAALLLAATSVFFLARRSRPAAAERAARGAARLAPVLYLAGFFALGFHQAAVVIPGNHARFLEARAARPPPPELARIEVHPEFLHLAAWILEHTRPDDPIMCDVPKMLHLMTGRPTVPFTFYGKSRRLAEEVQGRRPAYVYYSGEIDWIYRIFKEACEGAGYEKVFSRWVDVGGGERIEPALYRVRRKGS